MSAKKCVFCDQEQTKERFIGSIHGYSIVATRGQITDGGYVLAIPPRHARCIGELDAIEVYELGFALRSVRRHLLTEYQANSLLVFEHGIVGQPIEHAHLHIIPDDALRITDQIRSDFPSCSFQKFGGLQDFHETYGANPQPYLLWMDPHSSWYMVCWNPVARPQYLRLITADVAGRPERGNWREMDQTLDEALCMSTVNRLKPHFHPSSMAQ